MPLLRSTAPRFLVSTYHFALAFFSAVLFGFPSRKLAVIAVTGTKGKSTVAELVNAILEEAGFATALSSTIRVKIRGDSKPNLHKMTMPGRFFLQSFLRRAVRARCTHAVLEMTSEGAAQFRHKFIALDALIFTNLAPEHIESHGSYEKYAAAKAEIAKELERSPKRRKLLVVNGDDAEAKRFLAAFGSGTHAAFSLGDAAGARVSSEGVSFVFEGTRIESRLPGEFNLCNILAAARFAKEAGIPLETIRAGVEKVKSIRGRAERVEEGQDFSVIVDYAHTPDSLEKLYRTFAGTYRICVLGSAGGGRDRWKRPAMGAIAEKHCDEVILTNEDPYDENPGSILADMAAGFKQKEPRIMLDRRGAIRAALRRAGKDDAVLITGKGTDPYLMGPRGEKTPWDDAAVVREELRGIRSAGF